MDEAQIARELALRLLSTREYDDPQWTPTQLLVGQVPSEAGDLPLPPNSRVLGSLMRGHAHIEIELDVDRSPDEVRTFYSERLTAAGWRVMDPHGQMMGGFSHTATQAQHTLFCQGKRSPAIMVVTYAQAGQPVQVRLTLNLDSRQSPCAHIEDTHDPWHMLPDLRPPAGAYQVPSGGSGGGDSLYSTATLTSDLDVSQIRAHYQAQLGAQGWTKEAEGGDDTVAWSRWMFQDKDGEAWRGLFALLPLNDTPRQYTVQVHAMMAGEEGPLRGPRGRSTFSIANMF